MSGSIVQAPYKPDIKHHVELHNCTEEFHDEREDCNDMLIDSSYNGVKGPTDSSRDPSAQVESHDTSHSLVGNGGNYEMYVIHCSSHSGSDPEEDNVDEPKTLGPEIKLSRNDVHREAKSLSPGEKDSNLNHTVDDCDRSGNKELQHIDLCDGYYDEDADGEELLLPEKRNSKGDEESESSTAEKPELMPSSPAPPLATVTSMINELKLKGQEFSRVKLYIADEETGKWDGAGIGLFDLCYHSGNFHLTLRTDPSLDSDALGPALLLDCKIDDNSNYSIENGKFPVNPFSSPIQRS